MNKKIYALLLAGLLLCLCGCHQSTAETTAPATLPPTEPTIGPTIPADGDPNDVTCKGSYFGTPAPDSVVAAVGDTQLTNDVLQVWYQAEIAQFRAEVQEAAPDFDAPLDTQECPIDNGVNSWQQYFLGRALNRWHSAQAMELAARQDPRPTEEAYKPDAKKLARYMTGMPATQFLYGYNTYYQPNTQHQAYLDAIPQLLAQLAEEKGLTDAAALAAKLGASVPALEEYARLYNFGYMYFTELGYGSEASHPEPRESVDIRHLLLLPEGAEIGVDGTVTCAEENWAACMEDAQALLTKWVRTTKETEADFGELAYRNSADTASAKIGGAYRDLRQGQLIAELDGWCFDPARQAGETTIVRSPYGCHILFFCGESDSAGTVPSADLIEEAMARFPMEVSYPDIVLTEGQALIAPGEILYPDVAHERYPEVPLYLQQNYEGVMFGGDLLRSHGCGITTFSMLTSYMTDEEWTPPEMCALYGRYSYGNGTDGMLYINEPKMFDYYLIEKTYEPSRVKQALADGYIVISIQHKGYWTGGGHYIMLEKMTEDGMIQVRDSNIFNYGKLPRHAQDKHTFSSITESGSGYWVFEKKSVNSPACHRCGDPDTAVTAPLAQDWQCPKCTAALTRRNTWLTGLSQ